MSEVGESRGNQERAGNSQTEEGAGVVDWNQSEKFWDRLGAGYYDINKNTRLDFDGSPAEARYRDARGGDVRAEESQGATAEEGRGEEVRYSAQRNELPNEPQIHRVIDGETLKQLRRTAAGLERTQDGVFLYVAEDGTATATGPKGTRIPDAFRRFAHDNDLAFYAERRIPRAPSLAMGEGNNAANAPRGITHKSEPMPIAYRESGARYFGEDVGEAFDRTDRARFSTQRLAPNGKPSNLNELQWNQVRTPEFKAWFGDWEAFAILNGNPLAYLKAADAPKGRYKDIEMWAAAIFEKQGGIAVREGIGEILLDERSAKTAMAHSGANDYKKVAFASVKDVIERGALVHKSSTSEEDSFYFSAPIDIDGVTNIETVLVHRDVNTKRMYLHSVTTKENLLSKRVSGADDLTSKLAGSTNAEGIRRIIQDLIIGKDISKVVDKNGAPLVVYHGTMTSDLFEFNPRASVELYGRPEGIDAIGSWFSTDKSYAKGFGDNLAETYLSIKNPAVYESWEALMSEWSDENSSKSASKSAKTRHKANQHNGDAAAFRDLLIAEGFDGIQIKPHKTDRSTEFDGRSAYIAFSPTQIKSAIGNNGQFDGSNPDIRYSKASSSEQEETSKQFAKRSVAHAPEHQFHTAHCCNQR